MFDSHFHIFHWNRLKPFQCFKWSCQSWKKRNDFWCWSWNRENFRSQENTRLERNRIPISKLNRSSRIWPESNELAKIIPSLQNNENDREAKVLTLKCWWRRQEKDQVWQKRFHQWKVTLFYVKTSFTILTIKFNLSVDSICKRHFLFFKRYYL